MKSNQMRLDDTFSEASQANPGGGAGTALVRRALGRQAADHDRGLAAGYGWPAWLVAAHRAGAGPSGAGPGTAGRALRSVSRTVDHAMPAQSSRFAYDCMCHEYDGVIFTIAIRG